MSSLGNKAVFARNLSNIMSERDLSQKELCATLGFSESTFSDWINAKAYPRIDKIEKLDPNSTLERSEFLLLNDELDSIIEALEKENASR